MVGFRNISYNYRKPSMGTEGNMELGLKIPGRPAQAALLNFIPGSHPLILPPKPHPPSSLLQPKRMGDFIVTHSRGCQEFTAPLLPAGDKSQGQSTRKVIHPPGSGFVYKHRLQTPAIIQCYLSFACPIFSKRDFLGSRMLNCLM